MLYLFSLYKSVEGSDESTSHLTKEEQVGMHDSCLRAFVQ